MCARSTQPSSIRLACRTVRTTAVGKYVRHHQLSIPRTVADALVSLATRPRPSTYIGVPARPGILAHALAPDLVVRSMKWLTDKSLQRTRPALRSDGNLYESSRSSAIDGGFRATRAINPAAVAVGAIAAALGALALAGLRGRRRRQRG